MPDPYPYDESARLVAEEIAALEAAVTAARAHAERLEREYRKKLASLRNEEEKRYAAKDRQIADLAHKAKVTEKRSLIASAYFWLA